MKEGEIVSEMDDGHMVDNGESKTNRNVSNREILKKLNYLQEKILELEERQKKIEENTKGPGGSQPSKHFSRDALIEEKCGQQVLSELGKELKDKVDMEGQLDKTEFKRLMNDHGWSASTDKTYRNWMEKISAHFDSFRFEVGDNGGSNKPSRIVWEGY